LSPCDTSHKAEKINCTPNLKVDQGFRLMEAREANYLVVILDSENVRRNTEDRMKRHHQLLILGKCGNCNLHNL